MSAPNTLISGCHGLLTTHNKMLAVILKECPPLQLLDVDVPELDQTWRPEPFSISVTAVVLESEAALFRQSRQDRVINHLVAVQDDTDRIPFDGDLKRVPLAYILVSVQFWRYRRPDVGRCLRVGTVAIELT